MWSQWYPTPWRYFVKFPDELPWWFWRKAVDHIEEYGLGEFFAETDMVHDDATVR
jgi:hypothetical protein